MTKTAGKSAKICSPTVATAEYNKQLDQFVASYSSVKKIPNLTKLATTDMPKGRGCKGSKGPVKRKPPVPIDERIKNLTHRHQNVQFRLQYLPFINLHLNKHRQTHRHTDQVQ